MASKVGEIPLQAHQQQQLTEHSYSTTALVPLSPYPNAPTLSFTHGSLRPSYPQLLPYPSRINELGHSLLLKALTPPLAPPHPPNPYSGLPATATRNEAELYDAGGPLWWRGLAEGESDDQTACGWARELRDKLGVRRVIGVSLLLLHKFQSQSRGDIAMPAMLPAGTSADTSRATPPIFNKSSIGVMPP
jgi:hypothetical protein